MEDLDHPELGPLRWEATQDYWLGYVDLPELAPWYCKWTCRDGAPDDRRRTEWKAGRFRIDVFGPGLTAPSPAQVEAVRYLKANGAAVADALAGALLEAFREAWLDGWRQKNKWVTDAIVAHVATPAGIRETVFLRGVHVFPAEMDGVAPVAYRFGCCWHPALELSGPGVLLHRDQVLAVMKRGE